MSSTVSIWQTDRQPDIVRRGSPRSSRPASQVSAPPTGTQSSVQTWPAPIQTNVHPLGGQTGQLLGAIQILTGPSAGKELELVKNLTTLGKPGVQVAVITRRPQGYFITHVEGKHPIVNGESIGAQAHRLQDHDVVELAGVKMEFFQA